MGEYWIWDAMDMPFAQGYFDTIISVDSYHYFGCKENVFAEKILPFVKKDGYVMIAIPGLKEEPQGELKEIFSTWTPHATIIIDESETICRALPVDDRK